MSHLFTKIACVSAGLVIAALAAGSAIAAKPIAGSKPQPAKQSLSVKQKNDLARAMAGPNASKKTPPKPTGRAKEGVMVDPGGAESAVVPEELDHYLTAKADALGRMRVRDIDVNAKPAAAVETTNEK